MSITKVILFSMIFYDFFMIYYCNLDFVLVDEVSHGLWNCIKISKYIFDFSIRIIYLD